MQKCKDFVLLQTYIIFYFFFTERGLSPFPVRGRDRGGKTGLLIRGGIKVGDGKRGLRGFPLKGEGEGVWYKKKGTYRGEVRDLPVLSTSVVPRTSNQTGRAEADW